MFQHILFATDGSFPAERAADYAAGLAIRFHAKVTVLHAYTPITIPMSSYTFPNADAFADDSDAQALVKQVAGRLRDHGVPDVETQVIQGQPAHVILGVAESIQPDVIVMGARGVSTWQGLLRGSTSISVVQRAQIPVLVVK